MRSLVVVVGLTLSLAGCAGSPVGDALAGPEKLAERDDAYCRSIGAQGDAYTHCRLSVTQQRQANHNARLGMAICHVQEKRTKKTS